ncbi:MAG: hypothetical protein HQL33_03850 [Alphaproteobacteria bacterium]|nr:hypothetical protein [Alphaproteobacteria bacterium]MBF0129104.1 hypothetical protein [Alphaproteobacteria bacterium]
MAMKPEPQPQSLPSQESLLLDYVKRLEQYTKGRKAVHIRLSRLSGENRQPQRLKIAINTFESMVKLLQGQMFLLGNADIMFIYKGESADDVESAIVKLQFMFSSDSLLLDAEDGQFGEFALSYDLERQYPLLLKDAQALAAEESKRSPEPLQQSGAAAGSARSKPLEPLTPAVLFRLEESLVQADLSNLVRRQSVCAIVGKSPPQPVFVELFVSIAELRATVLPNTDILSSRWLFQHLTDTLDRRVLSMLHKNDDRSLDSDFSVNLNVATIISPEFLKFDDSIKAGARNSIVLELQEMDVIGDLAAYLFARDFAHECGYKVLVDGVTRRSLPFVNRARLGADLIKLLWQADIPNVMETDQGPVFRDLLKSAGPSRIILARCDDQTAIDFGKEMGISLFQGRYIEELLAAENAARNTKPAGRAPKRY